MNHPEVMKSKSSRLRHQQAVIRIRHALHHGAGAAGWTVDNGKSIRLSERLTDHRNAGRLAGVQNSGHDLDFSMASHFKHTDGLRFFCNGILWTYQHTAAAAVANLGEYHWFFLNVHKGVEAAEVYTLSASGASACIEIR